MNDFEAGQYVRLRAGGRIMRVIAAPPFESPLVACEYREKHRRVTGLYAASALIRAPAPHQVASARSG
ncbi:hypothetical protein OU800_12505 [Pseudomonas sp. GOM7]|uniref:hypothetical protein n=1 Tax=Pseudomonas sp. GOM7 TaxID=2998079 RepID=UPI00227C2E68|nr:hypothetical protein [Pseudomonas sp. GOM7]WAJ35467.1 hypothetical protein OU800_12505 [Pseudomonas sp. GOM7]